MASTFRSDGGVLHHAVSMGNIDSSVCAQTNYQYKNRNYDSEDENIGRVKCKPFGIKSSVYSKEDIIDQYCLTDRQLNNSVEPEKKFLGCFSTKNQQSFLGVCVGRQRAPSDENIQDYAPYNRHPRIQKIINHDDLEGSYFNRKPTSFLRNSDYKKFSWMTSGETLTDSFTRHSNDFPLDSLSNTLHENTKNNNHDRITGYRCPAHMNTQTSNLTNSQQQLFNNETQKTKHVSFARSLTLASFDDTRHENRILNTNSQERLIGGKKPTLTITHQPSHHDFSQICIPQSMNHKSLLQQTYSHPYTDGRGSIFQAVIPHHQYQQQLQQHQNVHETHSLDKQKRNSMKTQATQTDKSTSSHTLSVNSCCASKQTLKNQIGEIGTLNLVATESRNGNMINHCSTDENILVNLNKTLSDAVSYATASYQTHSLPRRSCIHHLDEFHTNSLPRSPRMEHHIHDHENNHLYASSKHDGNSIYVSKINQSPSYVNVGNNESPDSIIESQLQKVPQLISSNQEEILCSTCSSSSNSEESGNEYGTVICKSEGETREQHGQSETNISKNKNEKEIFIDFKPILKFELSKSSEYENQDIKRERLKNDTRFSNDNGSDKIEHYSSVEYPENSSIMLLTTNQSIKPLQSDDPSEDSEFEKCVLEGKPQEKPSSFKAKSSEHLRNKTKLMNFEKAYYSSDEEKLSFVSNEEEMQKKHSDNLWNISQSSALLKQNSSPTESLDKTELINTNNNTTIADLDIEDIANQPLPPLPVNLQTVEISTHETKPIHEERKLIKSSNTPAIAVINTHKSEDNMKISKHVFAIRKDLMRSYQEKEMKRNLADASEGSTTEDYATCTDNYKIPLADSKKSSKSESSFLTINTSGENSGVRAKGGSSIESASSFHSLRNDTSQNEELRAHPSPALSLSSSSSESYCVPPPVKAPSPRHTLPKMNVVSYTKKKAQDSISDDCEKVISSSHDEKENTKPQRVRRSRDWTEEERRRKKCNFKMILEKDPTKTGKQASPDSKHSGINTIELASPNHYQKRFRPKLKKPTRGRAHQSEVKSKNSSEKKISQPSSSNELKHKFCQGSHKKIFPVQHHLIAASNESLRSISPGSDSVFYEADFNDNNPYCCQCGKEVNQDGIEDSGTNEGHDNIVQPPEGFADSPIITPSPSKLTKRYRIENKIAHHKGAGNHRAKSEERGTHDNFKEKIKCADSTPSIAHESIAHHDISETERGVYQGNYVLGEWVSIQDIDIWRKSELEQIGAQNKNDEHYQARRDSTDIEKDFRKKYQAIAHRMVHRRSCLEMYKRLLNNEKFETDRKVIVHRVSGEFGFRIHGSRPVVVSAIEDNTPAQTSGLSLGDIVLSVNGIAVLEKSHSDVVKIAHAGSDVLELEVAAPIASRNISEQTSVTPLHSGYLWMKIIENDEYRWIRRWFCVKHHCLYYYKFNSDLVPLNVIGLTKHKVYPLSKEKTDRAFSFIIEYFTSSLKPVQLAADTDNSSQKWVYVLNKIETQDSWLKTKIDHLKFPARSIPSSDCSGYLMKLGMRWRSWVKRYCLLKDACLYFYDDADSKNAIGMACLQGYKVQQFSTGNRKHAFELSPPDSKYRSFYFHSDSEIDKKRWIAAFEYSIDRWIKIVN